MQVSPHGESLAQPLSAAVAETDGRVGWAVAAWGPGPCEGVSSCSDCCLFPPGFLTSALCSAVAT